MGSIFYFKQAYGLMATASGFRCKIETNHGNLRDVSYNFTTQELADISAGKIVAMDIVKREVKRTCDAFCAELESQFNINQWTVTSGNYSRVMAAPAPAVVTFNTSTVTSLTKQGNYVPLYSWNANGYQQVIADKQNYPDVPIIAAINPASGPGTAKSATIDTAVKAMQAAGITVLGYVGTNYGSELTKAQYPVGNPWPSSTPNTLVDVEGRCLNYVQWYGVDGFMFDDFSNKQFITMPDSTQKDVYNTFYAPLFQYCRGLTGIKYIKGNMGTKPLYLPLVDLCDNVCVYEGSTNPTLTQLQNNTYNGQLKDKATIVVYNTATLDTTALQNCGQYAKYYYSSDSGYSKPPIYYDSIIQTLAGL